MHPSLQKLQETSSGLLYISESEYPFEPVYSEASTNIEEELLKLSGKPNETTIEKTTVEAFFKNSTTLSPNATALQQEEVNKYLNLLKILEEVLTDIEVYKIGNRQIAIFIIGKLPDGNYGGLQTKAIET